MDNIAVLSPVYQSADYILATAESVKNLPWIISDNASTDETVNLVKDNFPDSIIYKHSKIVERTENWAKAIHCFLANSSFTWMKWLFAGDLLRPDAKEAIHQAIHEFPEAKLFVWQVEELDSRMTRIWKPPLLQKSKLLYPEESLYMAAKYGNWFGPPIAQAFHRDCLSTLDKFGKFPWVADMEICLNAARQFPVAYIDEPIGQFVLSNRKYFQKLRNKPETIFEEGLLKLKAAEWFEEVAENKQIASDLRSTIQFQALKHLIQRNDLQLAKQIKEKFNNILKRST